MLKRLLQILFLAFIALLGSILFNKKKRAKLQSPKTQVPVKKTNPIKYYTDYIGKVGEDDIFNSIESICKINCGHFHLLRNIALPTKKGFSETDILLLHETGIYVFECKNLLGQIHGDFKSERWLQKNNESEKYFYNPILQNKRHITHIYRFLKQNKIKSKTFNIIVFGNKSELRLTNLPKNIYIYKLSNLEQKLLTKLNRQKKCFKVQTLNNWHAKLKPYEKIYDEFSGSYYAQKQIKTKEFPAEFLKEITQQN